MVIKEKNIDMFIMEKKHVMQGFSSDGWVTKGVKYKQKAMEQRFCIDNEYAYCLQ